MHSVACGGAGIGSGRGGRLGRGIVCWLEERLVKQHPGWIMPGAVWLVEGARLALFSSFDDLDEEDGDGGRADRSDGGGAVGADASPSTDAARGGGGIDRMILVGESSLVYAWTPDEAASCFADDEWSQLSRRRWELGPLEGKKACEVDGDKKPGEARPMSDSAAKANSNYVVQPNRR